MKTLCFLILMLLPLLVITENEIINCLSCETDADCAVGACIVHQCTDEVGLFADSCDCQSDIDCDSGLCGRLCGSTMGDIVTCAELSDCLDGDCALRAVCVSAAFSGSPMARPVGASENKIMPVWMALIIAGSILGAVLCILVTSRIEACRHCCCECLSSCCLICDA
jgi:hypothetical protein